MAALSRIVGVLREVTLADLVPPAAAMDWLTSNILLDAYCDRTKRCEGDGKHSGDRDGVYDVVKTTYQNVYGTSFDMTSYSGHGTGREIVESFWRCPAVC